MSEAEYRTGAFFPAPIFTKLGPIPLQRHDLRVGMLTPNRWATCDSLRSDSVFINFSKLVAVKGEKEIPHEAAGLLAIT